MGNKIRGTHEYSLYSRDGELLAEFYVFQEAGPTGAEYVEFHGWREDVDEVMHIDRSATTLGSIIDLFMEYKSIEKMSVRASQNQLDRSDGTPT